MTDSSSQAPAWRRIATLGLWLYLMPPMGLWKLWHDTSFGRGAKWRILLYLFVLPALVYATVSIWMTNQTLQRVLP